MMKFVLKCVFCHDQKDHKIAWNEAKVHQLLQSSGNKYIPNLIGCEMIEKSLKFTKTPTDTFLMLLPYFKVSTYFSIVLIYSYKVIGLYSL